jgi:hypothetical protein
MNEDSKEVMLDPSAYSWLHKNLFEYKTVQEWFIDTFVETTSKSKKIEPPMKTIMKNYFNDSPIDFYRFINENTEVEYFVRVTGKVEAMATGTMSKDHYESGLISDEDFCELFWNDDDRDIEWNNITKTDVDVCSEHLSLSGDFCGKGVECYGLPGVVRGGGVSL